MRALKLLLILLFPSLLVGIICVADRGLGAILLSPILVLLPIAQFSVWVSDLAVIFPYGMVFSAVLWTVVSIFIIQSQILKEQSHRARTAVVVGMLHASSMPWAVNSLKWYA